MPPPARYILRREPGAVRIPDRSAARGAVGAAVAATALIRFVFLRGGDEQKTGSAAPGGEVSASVCDMQQLGLIPK